MRRWVWIPVILIFLALVGFGMMWSAIVLAPVDTPNPAVTQPAPRRNPPFQQPQPDQPSPTADACWSVRDQAIQLQSACEWYVEHSGTEVPVRITGGYVEGASAGVVVLAMEIGDYGHQQTVWLARGPELGQWTVVSVE